MTISKCEECKFIQKKRYPHGVSYGNRDFFYFCAKRNIAIREKIINRECPYRETVPIDYYVNFATDDQELLEDLLLVYPFTWKDACGGYCANVDVSVALKVVQLFKKAESEGKDFWFKHERNVRFRDIDWDAYFK